MARFFNIPFATSAAKTTIPDTDAVSVSWSNGYTVNYEYDPTVTGSEAKHVERDVFNTLLYDVTSSLQAIQLNGIAPYYSGVTSSSGPGYNEGSIVIYANKAWRSKLSGNKIIPNASTTANWEEVTGYDTLVSRLKDAGLIGAGAGGDNYTKEEIDALINGITNSFDDYYMKDLGEIYFLSWCDENRNAEGFFMCNGDMFPYTNTDPTSSDEFYGNALYSLCYDTTEGVVTETDFKKRWNIVVNESNKTIGLPNILKGDYDPDKANFLVTLGSTAGIYGVDASKDQITAFTTGTSVSQVYEQGNLAVRFKMIPCVYLGIYNLKDDSNEEG